MLQLSKIGTDPQYLFDKEIRYRPLKVDVNNWIVYVVDLLMLHTWFLITIWGQEIWLAHRAYCSIVDVYYVESSALDLHGVLAPILSIAVGNDIQDNDSFSASFAMVEQRIVPVVDNICGDDIHRWQKGFPTADQYGWFIYTTRSQRHFVSVTCHISRDLCADFVR